MPEAPLCKLCAKRRARRDCPALHAGICTVCCGTQREVTISCPLECQYLREGHEHEKPLAVEDKDIAEPRFDLSDRFINENEPLLLIGMTALLKAALATSGAVDNDVLAALQTMLKTHHTQESGLIYQHHSENLVADNVQREYNSAFEEFRKNYEEGFGTVRSSQIFGVLVFLTRLAQRNSNGRPRGRMFIDVLTKLVPDYAAPKKESTLIL